MSDSPPAHPNESSTETSSEQDNSTSTVRSRELENLKPTNRPGLAEASPTGPRRRKPSFQKAKIVCEESLRAAEQELEEFKDQNFPYMNPEALPQTDIKPRYRKLRLREQALILAAEDLRPILEKSGLKQDLATLNQQVDAVVAQTICIKLTYNKVVSKFTETDRSDLEIKHSPRRPYRASPKPSSK